MRKKPDNLVYGLDDKPPLFSLILLGLQHYMVASIGLIFPVILISSVNGSDADAELMVSICMLTGGISVILQSLRTKYIGCGYLLPPMVTSSFLPASIMAAQMGGLPLVFGMTAFAGFSEVLIARVINKIKVLFPPEVTGLVIMMVGISMIKIASNNFFAVNQADPGLRSTEVSIAALTLFTMVGINIWSKGKLNLYSVIIGILVGYVFSTFFGILGNKEWGRIASLPFFKFPFLTHPGLDFKLVLVFPFLIGMICSTLKSLGNVLLVQRINDAKWVRTDMESVKKGLSTDGIGCAITGLLGGFGQSTSAGNIGLSVATGATSRIIAWSLGIIMIIFSMLPQLAGIFAVMPKPVMGATLFYSLSFMIIAGLQVIMSRMIDSRKTFVIGLSMIFGITTDLMPEFFAQNFHPYIQPLFANSLTSSALVAILLNLISRIGIKKRSKLEVEPNLEDFESENYEAVKNFMTANGKLWGARQEVIEKVIGGIHELSIALAGNVKEGEKIFFDVAFDEFKIEVEARYKGEKLMLSDETGSLEMTDLVNLGASIQLRLLRYYTDKIKSTVNKDDSFVFLEFEH